MANENEEEYEVPSSSQRKGIELSRGIVLMPPERMKKIEEEAKEEEKEIAQKKTESKTPTKEVKPTIARQTTTTGTGLTPSITNIIAIIALLAALVAIGFSLMILSSYNQMKNELKGVILDLESYKKSNITVNVQLTAEHAVQEDIALRDILSPSSIPVSTVLGVQGNLLVYNPVTRLYDSSPYTGNLTVTGAVNIDPSLLDPSKKMRLNYTIPGKAQMIMSIPADKLWTSDLDSVLNRLEKMTK